MEKRQFMNSITTLMVISLLGKFTLVDGLCGYSSCPKVKEGFLNVHLVAHSHDDLGWLKTVDQYYYGDKNRIQRAAVQYTIDSVIEQLQKSPDRRFIYVETGFFWRWWTNQDDETKNIVQKLVASGQLEFISGGWVMNDEAAPHYNAIIDQMSLGLRFLNETFGQCGLPRVAWQIDPFGHSREQASLFAQMGFDGLFFGRLDYHDKFNRLVNKQMEFMWNGSPKNFGKSASLFTGVLYNGYNPPDGFCFDINCEDDPINDDPKLFDYNLDTKVQNFIKISQQWAEPYNTQNVLMTMGSDFQYIAAHTWYKNLDKLIKHVNSQQVTNSSKVNLFYSTPSCYLQEVNRKLKTPLTVKTDDFFPYASEPHAFWTGYYTSRPTLKYYTHKSNNFLQACKQVALSGFKGKVPQGVLDKIWVLEEAVAVMQHHDAVTGTARQHVTDDYSKRLAIGIKKCEEVFDVSIRKMYARKNPEVCNESEEVRNKRFFKRSFPTIEFCQELNISACAASETKRDFILSVYNPLVWDAKDVYIRIPVVSPAWNVRGPDGLISYQSIKIPKSVTIIPGRESQAEYNIVFKQPKIPSLSFVHFQLTKNEELTVVDGDFSPELRNQLKAFRKGPDASNNEDFWIANSNGLEILFDGSSGLMKKMKRNNSEIDLIQNFFYYPGMAGNNTKFEYQASGSGAYIFRPNVTNSDNQPLPVTEKLLSYFVYKGEHVTEVHQVFTEWISQVIRLYDTVDSVEFEWLVGPIPIDDKVGKEIVTRYTSDLKTNGVFFTDSNGRELLKRKRDFRPTWDYKVYESIAGNYYPVNSRLIISEDEDLKGSDEGKTLILLNDRTQGGTSMNDGEIELMVHRRLLYDDNYGLREALNETAYGTGLVASGKHWLVFAGDKTGVPVSSHRKLAQEIFLDKIYTFSDVQKGYSAYMEKADALKSFDLSTKESIFTKLRDILPANIHLLTLEPISTKEYILRLEHFYEYGKSMELSKKVVISLKRLKRALPFIKDLKETTLGGNQWKEDATRLQWPTVDDSDVLGSTSGSGADDPDSIKFSPMQIRTYIVSVK